MCVKTDKIKTDKIETDKIIFHFSDFFTESDKFMDIRIENALKNGQLIGFWQAFFFCDHKHASCKKLFYLFTERQLYYLKEWVKITSGEDTAKEKLDMSGQNFFSKFHRINNRKFTIQDTVWCIKQEPSGPHKISFIQKLVKVIFKLPEKDEKSNPNSPNFFLENWISRKINNKPNIYMEDLLGNTLTNVAAQEYFGTGKAIDRIEFYLGDDCGYDYPGLIYCDKFDAECPFNNTASST